MKERSINDLYQTPKSQSRPYNYTNIYAKVKQKYQATPHSPTQQHSETILKKQNIKESPEDDHFTKRRSRKWTYLTASKQPKTNLVESQYLTDSVQILKKDLIPPLVESIKMQKSQIEHYAGGSGKKNKAGEVENINLTEEDPTKNKFLAITVESLYVAQKNSYKKECWAHKKKSVQETLSGVLMSQNKLRTYLKNQQEQSIKMALEDRQANENYIQNNQLLALLLQQISNCKNQGQAYPKIVRVGQQMEIKFEGSELSQGKSSTKEKLVEYQKKLSEKNQFMEEVKGQYDKIINNYAATVMNIIKDKYGGQLPQIPEVSKLTEAGILSKSQYSESDEIEEEDQMMPLLDEPGETKKFKLHRKNTFGF